FGRDLFDLTTPRGHGEIAITAERRGAYHRRYALLRFDVDQVHDRQALCRSICFGDHVCLKLKHPAAVGEKEDAVMRFGHHDVPRHVLIAEYSANDAAAAPTLRPIRIRWQPLHIPTVAHGYERIDILDRVFERNFRVVIERDTRATRVAELLLQIYLLVTNQGQNLARVS